MTVFNTGASLLAISGHPVSTPLRDVHALSREMVRHFTEHSGPCRALPGRDATTEFTRLCLELAVSRLDGTNAPGLADQLRDIATRWVRAGVPVSGVLRTVHEAFRAGFTLVVQSATERWPMPTWGETPHAGSVDPADVAAFTHSCTVMVEVLEAVTTIISTAYAGNIRNPGTAHDAAARTVTAALLGGRPTAAMARELGIAIATQYSVLAMSMPPLPGQDCPQALAYRLRRVRAELVEQCGELALSILSTDGGTILLPCADFQHSGMQDLVTALSNAAHAPLTAAVITAAPASVPAAAELAHELLDVIQRLHRPPRLYRFHDLALEYQLTRPGQARDSLAALLDPLADHPELMHTLRVHLGNHLNRQRTAHMLGVHANTVDYRLKRVHDLVGLDATRPASQQYLHAALIARDCETP
ncbi:PucR family transcriptional regulator [Nocardia sp. NPDC055321]